MEETLTKEEPELECKTPDETQGGIRRRLRDRDLLRKRKAEAEEKETNQVESRKSRARREESSGRRGRPRKTEPEILVIPEEPALVPEAPVGAVDVDVVPEPVETFPAQPLLPLTPLLPAASQPVYVPDAPVPIPVVPSVQTPVLAPSSASLLAPVREEEATALAPDAVQTPVSAQVPAPTPTSDQNTPPSAPIAQSSNMALAETSVLAPSQADSVYTEPTGRETLDQVLIEDLGPDEQEDVSSSQKKVGEQGFADFSEQPSLNEPEQNNTLSDPSLTSRPPLQRYFPGL